MRPHRPTAWSEDASDWRTPRSVILLSPAAAQSRTTADDDLDRLARDWLTVMLLNLGVRGFEDWLEALEKPRWLNGGASVTDG
jgi:hypothetical protein